MRKTQYSDKPQGPELANKIQGVLQGTSSVPELESCIGDGKSNTPAHSTPDYGPQFIQ